MYRITKHELISDVKRVIIWIVILRGIKRIMARRSEQGNVLGFVLVGALLIALLLGGVWLVRNQLAKNNVQGTVATTSQSTANNTSDSSTSTGSSDGTGGNDLKDALAAQQTAEEKKAQEQKAAQDAEAAKSASTSESSTTTATTSTTLPTTGPEEALLPLAGAASLAGVSLAYARSRRLI